MSLRILVVDDEPTILMVAGAILEKDGFVVLSAQDGSEPLRMLEAQAVDALLTDLRMPGMSGTELILEARKRRPDLPICCMTASVEDTCLKDLPLMKKPFRPNELIKMVKLVSVQAQGQDARNGSHGAKGDKVDNTGKKK